MDNGATDPAQAQITRLIALADRQRAEIGRLRAEVSAAALVDLARGMLMERLGCSPAEARSELERIATDAGSTPAELAGQIVGLPPSAGVTRVRPAHAAPAELAAAASLRPDGSGVAAALLTDALTGTGAVGVAIWLVAPDGAMELAGQAGFPATAASAWRRVPPGVAALPRRAFRGQPADDGATWWPSGRPDGDDVAVIGPWTGARAALPIRHGGVAIGALEVCWQAAIAEFDQPLRRQLLALAELCAQVLGPSRPDRAVGAGDQGGWIVGVAEGLADSVLLGQAVRDCDGEVTDFRIIYLSDDFTDPAGRPAAELAGQSLLAVYPGAALPGGLFDAAADVLHSGQPRRLSDEVFAGQWSGRVAARIVPLFDGVVISFRTASEPERLAALLGHAERLGRIGGWEEVLASGEVYWTEAAFVLFGVSEPFQLADLDRHVPAEDVPAVRAFRDRLLRDKAAAAATFRITRSSDGSVRHIRAFAEPVLGPATQLVAVRGAYQDTSERYYTEVALAVTRGQLTESEQRAEEEHRLALRLQDAITPHSSRVEAGDLAVAARYRPASTGHLVGGDWYDAVSLPAGEVMLVVGDVAGHGIDAVTGMVALRNSLRGLALTGAGPGRLLQLLNQVCLELTDGVLGTAVCALYDPASRRLRWARAGHLPIILVRAGRARWLVQPSGLLLGAAPGVSYGEATATLEGGDALLLYTDGLIELRAVPIEQCLDSLIRLASRPVADIDAYADLVAAQATADTGDDACLLVVMVR